jgi:two-component system sensor kinase FixL
MREELHAGRAPKKSHTNHRAKLADVLQRICIELTRAPKRRLRSAIDGALAEIGEGAGADQALVAVRESGHFVQHYAWQPARGAMAAAASRAMDRFLGGLKLEHTVVCVDRKQLLATMRSGQPPDEVASGIFAPLSSAGTVRGVLALTRRTPHLWPAEAVKVTERISEMISAALDRIASHSSVAREQDARHQADETRRLREQLAHAGRVSMLGELAASLAHELNQPLTAIYTNAQAAHSFLDRKPPALVDALEALDDLGQDCRRAAEVLGRLREMFRRRETERVSLEVGEVVEHVLRLLHEDAVARGVRIALDVAPDTPQVKGDRVQLEQVVMNLLVNAFEALAESKGERLVTVRIGANRNSVKLAVLDNGPGVAPEDVERLFEAFFTRKQTGMGIGLSLCRTIVEAHGGHIRARKRDEGGSAFEVTLPVVGGGIGDRT